MSDGKHLRELRVSERRAERASCKGDGGASHGLDSRTGCARADLSLQHPHYFSPQLVESSRRANNSSCQPNERHGSQCHSLFGRKYGERAASTAVICHRQSSSGLPLASPQLSRVLCCSLGRRIKRGCRCIALVTLRRPKRRCRCNCKCKCRSMLSPSPLLLLLLLLLGRGPITLPVTIQGAVAEMSSQPYAWRLPGASLLHPLPLQ